ncbi:hypothetical protein K0M31_007925 [Melipona bicolor]|uniref:Uncharacterized protein n=1 Tax=Melipona bicolor TaxID=60889 RepID=A0AA40GD51_9HYME|nr:hypothetical protein K0M31_007925 [Melipona bicolor]
MMSPGKVNRGTLDARDVEIDVWQGGSRQEMADPKERRPALPKRSANRNPSLRENIAVARSTNGKAKSNDENQVASSLTESTCRLRHSDRARSASCVPISIESVPTHLEISRERFARARRFLTNGQPRSGERRFNSMKRNGGDSGTEGRGILKNSTWLDGS